MASMNVRFVLCERWRVVGRAALAAALLSCTAALGAETARQLLEQSGVSGGLVVHLGCGGGELTGALRTGPQYMVQGLDRSAEMVASARERLLSKGLYGPVSVDRWDGRHLPYIDNLVNLIVAEDPCDTSQAELMRVLAPGGVLLLRRDGRWEKIIKPWPEQMDQWTHYFHDADGNPVASDQMVGPPRRLQWIGTPRWSRHHDHMASLTSLVSAQGRVFYILDEGPRESIQLPADWRLVARDAFNGVILWKRKIDRWNTHQYPLKSGPAHLLRRLVAVGDRVYVTLGIDAPATVLDAATGQTLMTFEGSRYTREIVVCGATVFLVADNEPSRLPSWRRVSTYVWENTRQANPGWGWPGTQRKILAFDAQSGRLLWQRDAAVAPCSLATDGRRLVFHDGNRLVCLDPKSGDQLWQSEPAPVSLPVHTNTGPRVLLYEDVVLFAGNDGKMSGWSAADGRKLWERPHKPSGHMSLRDLLVVDGLVWTGAVASAQHDGVFTGYDPRTGEKKREFEPDVRVHWFHHRCYPIKASGHYLLVGRNGTEFVNLGTESWKPHHWVRGGCIYGVMPCNGLMYAPMDACGCQLEAKLAGFKALAPGPVPTPGRHGAPATPRLERGPAYGQVAGPEATADDWPMHRHDEARSGASSVELGASLGRSWQAQLDGRLTAPTVARGRVFVASIDTHTVHALDLETGKHLWAFTTGGRVDSAPTYYRGLLLFGSADGYVYAVRAADGELVWRFRAAPLDRRLMAWEQLESAWPVHGSVLVHDGVLYLTAGRSMFLEGGIHFLRLDPVTGRLLGEVVMDDKDPESNQDIHLAYLRRTQGNNMPVALSDILSCDGRYLWMRSQKIDFQGRRLEIGLENVTQQPPEDFHLFCQVGFLDDSYFFRTYWTYGRRVTGGYGGWLRAGRLVPSGRILCFDQTRVFGFGRKPEFMTNASVVQYQIFAADKSVPSEAIERVQKANGAINARSPFRNANSSDWLLRRFFPTRQLTAVNYHWTVQQPSLMVRAMVLTRKLLAVAGPPNFIDERQAYRMPDSPEVLAALKRQQEAMRGRHGGELWLLSKDDGQLVARYALDTIPVFDGMAVAQDRLLLSTVDGRLLCMSGRAPETLEPVRDRPRQIVWDMPEDPSYLLPPEEPKEEDFDRVVRCKVVAAKLGYRLTAKSRDHTALALIKLATPVTTTATFTTRLRAAPVSSGQLSNGFLAFGDGASDEQLVKCGVRLRAKQAMVIQGTIQEGQTQRTPITVPDNRPMEVSVSVDLATQQVTFTVDGVKIEAKLTKPLKSITYVGYALDNAVVDFAPIKVQ